MAIKNYSIALLFISSLMFCMDNRLSVKCEDKNEKSKIQESCAQYVTEKNCMNYLKENSKSLEEELTTNYSISFCSTSPQGNIGVRINFNNGRYDLFQRQHYTLHQIYTRALDKRVCDYKQLYNSFYEQYERIEIPGKCKILYVIDTTVENYLMTLIAYTKVLELTYKKFLYTEKELILEPLNLSLDIISKNQKISDKIDAINMLKKELKKYSNEMTQKNQEIRDKLDRMDMLKKELQEERINLQEVMNDFL